MKHYTYSSRGFTLLLLLVLISSCQQVSYSCLKNYQKLQFRIEISRSWQDQVSYIIQVKNPSEKWKEIFSMPQRDTDLSLCDEFVISYTKDLISVQLYGKIATLTDFGKTWRVK